MFKCVPELLGMVRITQKQAELLLFLFDRREFVLRKWPVQMRNRKIIASLVHRGYLVKDPHIPEAYAPTRAGFSWACRLDAIRKAKHAVKPE